MKYSYQVTKCTTNVTLANYKCAPFNEKCVLHYKAS